jgi:hypothetical protein
MYGRVSENTCAPTANTRSRTSSGKQAVTRIQSNPGCRCGAFYRGLANSATNSSTDTLLSRDQFGIELAPVVQYFHTFSYLKVAPDFVRKIT